VSKTDGFIAEARNTIFMSRFVVYMTRATVIGFLPTFCSIPLVIVDPKISPTDTAAYAVISLWFAVFIWAFIAVLRVAYIFGIVAKVRDKETFDG